MSEELTEMTDTAGSPAKNKNISNMFELCLGVCFFVFLVFLLFVYLFVRLSVCLSACMSVCMYACLFIGDIWAVTLALGSPLGPRSHWNYCTHYDEEKLDCLFVVCLCPCMSVCVGMFVCFIPLCV